MDIKSLNTRPQSTPPPGVYRSNDWYNAPTSYHVDSGSSQSSTLSTDYPVNRHRYSGSRSLTHHSSHTHPHLTSSRSQYAIPRRYSHSTCSNSSHRLRSASSPETQSKASQTHMHHNGDQPVSLQTRNSLQDGYLTRGKREESHSHVSYNHDNHIHVADSTQLQKVANQQLHEHTGMTGAGAVYQHHHSQPKVSQVNHHQHSPPDNSDFKSAQWDFFLDMRIHGSKLTQVDKVYPSNNETTSDQSLSDSTQFSELSEPTHKRPRPPQRSHLHRPFSAPKDVYHYSQSSEGTIPEQNITNSQTRDDSWQSDIGCVTDEVSQANPPPSLPRKHHFKVATSYPTHVQPHHPTHHTVLADGRVVHIEKHHHSITGPSPVHDVSREGEALPQNQKHCLPMRKIKSLQNVQTSETLTSYSDYPRNNMKIVSVIDQGVIECQMPEHVTVITDSQSVAPTLHLASNIPYSKASHKNHRQVRTHAYERVRTIHAYEQVDDFENEDGNTPPPAYSDIFPNIEKLHSSVKRNYRWSPGVQKHSNKTHTKVMHRGRSDTDVHVVMSNKRNHGSKKLFKKKHSTGSDRTPEGQAPQHNIMMNRYFPKAENSEGLACEGIGKRGGCDARPLHELPSRMIRPMLPDTQSRQLSPPHAVKTKSRDEQPPATCPPHILVSRPSHASSSVDDSALNLHSQFVEESASSLSVDNLALAGINATRNTQNSPKVKRRSSFKLKKLKIFRSTPDKVEDYEPLNSVNLLTRERVVSVSHAIGGSYQSPTSSGSMSSPRPYMTMSFIPATNKIVLNIHNSPNSDDDSIYSESDLDFGRGPRNETRKDEHEASGETSGSKKATAGSRGKSAGTVMMKLAKKFSKRNLPITRDDDDESLTNENERSSWRMKHRSNSVSNLDSLEGLTQRSQSMEHLAPFSVDQGRSSGMGSTPQGSPRMVRSWSKGKLNRRSADFENENAFSRLSHSGSRKNLSGNPVEDLFEAIELGNVEAVSSLIEANVDTKFNIVNEDEFLPVDLSVMLGYHMIAQILLANGAKDSPKFCRDPTFRLSRIKTLINEAERDLYRLKGDYISQNATNNSGIKDAERRYKKGEMRVKLYRHMLNNYESARVPGPPTNVHLHVTSNRSLMVTFSEPNVINHATVTRYKIEWCRNEEFRPVVGDFVMTDLRTMEYVIPDLDKGEKYYVRVSAYNMKGFGPSQVSDPPYAVPSSWHDINNTLPRYEGCTDKIHVVSAQFGLTVQNTPTMPPLNVTPTSTPIKARPIGRRGTNPLTRMFSSTVKFHKSLRPGVFITSLVYSDENKILITADDNIPIVEVSDSTSSSIGSDFVWMANLACTWEHVQAMCDISDGYTSSPAVHFRNKLLHAILDLQNSLGITDLGLLHPVPYKDSYGAIVFVIVRYLQDTKNVPTGNSSLRWIDLSKLWKRRTAPNKITGMEAFPVPDQIVLDAQEIIAHNYSSTRPLEKGLYLGYLKARSSVASMKIICSREYPNVLPHIKLRDNPNLNSEEWEWIKSLQYPNSSSPLHSSNPFSLQRTLLPAIDLFLKNLGFNKEEAENHQLYIHEAIELNENTTILLLLPPHEHVCTAPGSSDHFANLPDFVALPINTFEIMQLYTYQRSFMTKFSMVSTRLEVELLASHQQMREAFSKAEVAEAREKKSTLESFNSRTEQVWKQMRWIEDAVQKGRDHQAGSDDLLPISIVRQSIERQKKELSRSREEGVPPPVPPHRRKSITSINGISGSVHSRVNKEENVAKKSGYLRVIPSYQTGLARGTSVKLYIENTTTTLEVISLVVNQVAKATIGSSNVEFHEQDLSDFYLVAGIRGRSEWTLEPNYHPLQLQLETGTTGKVYLLVKRRSEENQLNQLITSV